MNLSEIYSTHHAEKNRLGFSVLEKERAAWFLAHAPTGGDWLDVGCRDGTLTKHFVERAKTIMGVDIDPVALAAAKNAIPGSEFFQMDLLGSWDGLGGRTFDVIVCSEVLEHVYFPDRVARKIKEHLKPGGVFIGSVPNAFFIKHRLRYLFGKKIGTPLEDPTHITQFNRSHLLSILEPIGAVKIEGYTRYPLGGLAKSIPGVFAFDFLFRVQS
jgi:2-polyprenyl-3-methyl-5-hydroxy-6-metoxy-1,4-benzoquinol methylase